MNQISLFWPPVIYKSLTFNLYIYIYTYPYTCTYAYIQRDSFLYVNNPEYMLYGCRLHDFLSDNLLVSWLEEIVSERRFLFIYCCSNGI